MKEDKNLTCGLIMPISAIDTYTVDHWEEVRSIIRESLEGTDLNITLVSDSDEVGFIHKRIVQNVFNSDIVICDVSAKNPNVMFELGMRLAFDKPAIIIKDFETQYSFDTGQIEHLLYPRNLHYSSIVKFKRHLRDKVVNTLAAAKDPQYTTFLKNFGTFVVSKLDEKPVGREELLLESIAELKDQFAALSRTIKPKQSQRAYSGLLAGLTDLERPITVEPGYPVREFVLRKRALGELTVESAKNPQFLNDLFSEFYESTYASFGLGGSDHKKAARREFANYILEVFP